MSDFVPVERRFEFGGGMVTDAPVTQLDKYKLENFVKRKGGGTGALLRRGIEHFKKLTPTVLGGKVPFLVELPDRPGSLLLALVRAGGDQEVTNLCDYTEQRGRVPAAKIRGGGDTPVFVGTLPCVNVNFIVVVMYSLVYEVYFYHYLELSFTATLAGNCIRVTDDLFAIVGKTGATIKVDFFSITQILGVGAAYENGVDTNPNVATPYKTISWTEDAGSFIWGKPLHANGFFYIVTQGSAMSVRFNKINLTTLEYVSTALTVLAAPPAGFTRTSANIASSLPDAAGNFCFCYCDTANVGTNHDYYAVRVNPSTAAITGGPVALFNATYNGSRDYVYIVPLANGSYAHTFKTVDIGGVASEANTRDRIAIINSAFTVATDLFDHTTSKGRKPLRDAGGANDTIFVWNLVDNRIEKITTVSTAPVVTTFYSPASDFLDSAGNMNFGRMNSEYIYGGSKIYGVDGVLFVDGIFTDYYLAGTIDTCAGGTSFDLTDPFGWYRKTFMGLP